MFLEFLFSEALKKKSTWEQVSSVHLNTSDRQLLQDLEGINIKISQELSPQEYKAMYELIKQYICLSQKIYRRQIFQRALYTRGVAIK